MPVGRRAKTLIFLWAAALVWLSGPSLRAESIPCVFADVDKIVAVGDLHGDYQNFVKILTGTRLVDEELRWTGGRTHLVQTGDILDRGPAARRIFDLLIRLEQEAEQAGGRVHVLIGNHEEMALAGISFDYPGFVTVDQFQSFLPDAYVEEKVAKFVQKKAAALPAGAEPPPISFAELQEYWQKIMDEDEDARAEYFRFLRAHYGPWLLGRNGVLKINDIVFAHGGLSESFAGIPLEKLNALLRHELNLAMRGVSFRPRILFVRNSPLWYRDLALSDEKAIAKEVDRILGKLKARHMVIAHSPHGFGTVRSMERLGGRIWVIDTGISAHYGGHYSALIIDRQKYTPWGVMNGGK